MLRLTVAMVATSLVFLAGCGGSAELVDLLSGGAKLVSNPADPPIGDLTAAEWFAITNNLPELAAQFPELGIVADEWVFPELSRQQAQDLVDFLDRYGVQTLSELEALLDGAAQGEIEIEVPESLLALEEQFAG